MFRITKLVLSMSAVIALGVIAPASGTAAEFHSESSHSLISGEQHAGEDTSSVNAGTIRCSHRTYVGTPNTPTSATLRIAFAYSGCRAFGFVNTTIHTNGCEFVLHITSGATSIDCPVGQTITTTAYNCWVTTGSQGPLGPVTYTSNGTGISRDVTMDINITGLQYTQHSKSFPGCTNGSFNNGTYTGSMTMRAANTAGSQVGIWVQ